MNTPAALYRQGDVLLRALPAPQSLDGWRRRRSGVLVRGESGHTHILRERRGARLFEPRPTPPPPVLALPPGQPDPELLLEVAVETAHIDHPEHRTIPLPTGWYAIWFQREQRDAGIGRVAD